MKTRSTTPVSGKNSFAKRARLVFVCLVVAAISIPSLGAMQPVKADQYDEQIAALQHEINQYNNQAKKLDKQATNLEQKIKAIQIEKNQIQAKINIETAKKKKLEKEIAENKQKINDNKSVLGDTIANIYIDDNVSTLEMLASSSNIAEYIDKQTNREQVQSTLQKTIKSIQALKKKLEEQKKEVEKVLKRQGSQKAALAAKEAEQSRIMRITRGKQAAYQKLAGDAIEKQQNAAAQQRAYYASLVRQNGGAPVTSGVTGDFEWFNFSGNQGCGGGGYPYCSYPALTYTSATIDEYALYYRECVSYAAYRIENAYGRKVEPFNGEGMAYEWAWSASKYSGAQRVSNPQPGDAVVLPITEGFPVGHLMVVESVSGDTVHVSQYNWASTGEYSTMDIKKTGVIFLRFPSK